MKTALSLLALLVLTACSAPAPRPERAGPAAGTQPDKRVTVDPALRGLLRVNKVRDLPSMRGFLQFQVDVVNLTSSAKTIIYEVDWLDGEGLPLGISVEMPPHTLFPRETFPMILTAPAPTAKDFLLTFRPAQ
jgi:uncharacterized protein YcfL